MYNFLYRGVSKEMHDNNLGLLPKGNSFSSYVEMGSSIACMGNGISHGCSEENSVIGHQEDSSEYKTSGISTSPHYNRAVFYATKGGTQDGIIYKIEISKLLEYQVKTYNVLDVVNGPKVPVDDEIILIQKEEGALPIEIVKEIIKIYADDFNKNNY
jgi:hypothetical protein